MRYGVPEIEMNDDLNFSAMAHSDKQIIPVNIDYRLFKCLGGKVLNKTRRQRLIRTLRELQKNRTSTASRSMHVIFKRSRRSNLLSR